MRFQIQAPNPKNGIPSAVERLNSPRNFGTKNGKYEVAMIMG